LPRVILTRRDYSAHASWRKMVANFLKTRYVQGWRCPIVFRPPTASVPSRLSRELEFYHAAGSEPTEPWPLATITPARFLLKRASKTACLSSRQDRRNLCCRWKATRPRRISFFRWLCGLTRVVIAWDGKLWNADAPLRTGPAAGFPAVPK